MSSSERIRSQASAARALLLASGLAALATVAGCTVRPLYGDVTSATSAQGMEATQGLSSVVITPAKERVGQEVRNHLIFLLNGGQGQPANATYRLDLETEARSASTTTAVSLGRVDLEPTTAIVTVRTGYRLSEASTGRIVSAGMRTAQAPYDMKGQDFAALRAERDAQNRAAREVAELLRLAIAQELHKPTSHTVPDIVSSPEELDERLEAESRFD